MWRRQWIAHNFACALCSSLQLVGVPLYRSRLCSVVKWSDVQRA